MTTRTKGRWLAALILAFTLGVTGLAVLKARRAAAPTPSASGPESFAPPSTDRVIGRPIGDETAGGGGGVQDLVSLAEEGVFTRVNRETGELEYRMTWASLDPREGGVFLLAQPRAWIHEKGRVIEVTADSGRLRWPSREREPESGLLEGHVTIVSRTRAATAGGGESGGEEVLRILTSSLNFHTTLGELRTADEVTLAGSGVTMTGKGLTARFSQERARPLTYFRIDEGGRFAYDPPSPSARSSSSSASRGAGAGGSAAAPLSDGAAGAEAFYRAQFLGGVRLRTREQRVESEQALALARLIDGRLRPEAAGRLPAARPPGDDAGGEAGSAAGRAGAGDEGFTLEWSGPLEIRAALDEPGELAADDLFLRLESPSGAGVRMEDLRSGARSRCVSLDYGATRRSLSMFGAGPIGVTLTAPDKGEIVAGRFDVDLTTGVGAIPGPGVARAIGSAAAVDDPAFERGQRPREARWTERADFLLDTGAAEPGGASRGVGLPTELLLRGRVEARDGLAALRGDFVKAVFRRASGEKPGAIPGAIPGVIPGGDGARGWGISRIVAEGSATAEDGAGSKVYADAMEVRFVERGGAAGGSMIPGAAMARGNVRAERPGESLRAGMVDATLTTGAEGGSEEGGGEGVGALATLDASLGVEVRLSRAEAGRSAPTIFEVRGERLRGDRQGGVLELLGSPATIGRSRGEEAATLSGESMILTDGADRRGVTVFGAGSASSHAPATRDQEAVRTEIEWESGMVFDDLTGRAEAMGRVRGAAEFGERERHGLRGDRLILDFGPDEGGRRSLARALVESEAEAEPAEVELRRYAPAPGTDAAGAKLEALAFLRGPAVELDAATRTLRTPGAGTLLLEDRRPGAAEAGEAAGTRGTTVFDWNGEMWLSLDDGKGEMTRGVRIRHRRPGEAELTELECERLRITLEESGGEDSPRELALRGAEAIGAVFVRHRTLQVTADDMEYDAARSVIVVRAAPGNRVTIFDEAKGRHFVAEAAELNLDTGGWKAVKASGQMIRQ